MSISAAALHHELAPVLAPHGVDLEDVQLRRVGRATQVVVVIDRDGGVDLDTVAAVSRSIGADLDGRPEWADVDYTLQVTSPGVDRPLTTVRQWRRNIGRLVEVQMDAAALTGRITAVDGDCVEIEASGQSHRLDLGTVVRALVQVEFSNVDADEAKTQPARNR